MANKKKQENPVSIVLADPNNTNPEQLSKVLSKQNSVKNNLLKIDQRTSFN
jgi:hypothetical protein